MKKKTTTSVLQNIAQENPTQEGTTMPLSHQSANAGDPSIEEKIRQRAYEIYEASGRQEGNDVANWLEAEAEVSIAKRRS
jgi:hypothetical protein